MEGREVHVAQRTLRELGDVVVASPFRGAVPGKVLRRRRDRGRRAKVGPLEATHSGDSERGPEVGILARALDRAAPAWIAGDIHHRGKGPVYAYRGGFGC